MSRRHAEPVEVVRRDDLPHQFLWRGQLYVVRAVLDRWTEAGGWWAAATARALSSGDEVPVPAAAAVSTAAGPAGTVADDLVLAPIPAAPQWGQRAWGEPAPDLGASVGPASIDDGEREFWRVEAARGRASGLRIYDGVYDLCFAWSRGTWTVTRTLD